MSCAAGGALSSIGTNYMLVPFAFALDRTLNMKMPGRSTEIERLVHEHVSNPCMTVSSHSIAPAFKGLEERVARRFKGLPILDFATLLLKRVNTFCGPFVCAHGVKV